MSQDNAPQQTTPNPAPDDDYLGYGDYADTLWARILAALNKDAEDIKLAEARGKKPGLGDDPLVVGIFGEWGAGKSKLLKLILDRATDLKKQRERQRKQDGGNFDLTVPVFFQPWKYEHEEHLLVPMMLHILAALKDTLKKSKTFTETLEEKAEPYWQAALQTLPAVINVFESLVKAVVASVGQAAPAHMAPQLSIARWLAKMLPKSKQPTQNLANELKYSNDGRHYYQIHEYLKAVTRPKTNANIKQGENIRGDIRINFVIFIDDLDRCLPEKAVETLELIKTIFNAESFAFVLALDEEVVERGIGHRYRDYNFEGKKPEMPITGFEYLEKIVHLPFRLPALSEEQALQFVRRYEESIKKDADKRWFDAPWQPKPEKATTEGDPNQASRGEKQSGFGYDLLPMALQSFDAYVPRKLIRMVELMHQTAAVADKRGRPLSRHPVPSGLAGGGAVLDTRVVLALAMIQLFQPELYRIMRRRAEAFPFLLATFADRGEGKRDFPTAEMSDIDLWDWVAKSADSTSTAKRAHTGQAVEDAVKRIGEVYEADHTQRNYAQHTRLPVVMQLVEHRSAQRHVFDVLKLLQALAYSLEETALQAGKFGDKATNQASPAASLLFKPYRTLLAQSDLPVHNLTRVYADSEQSYKAFAVATDTRPVYTVRDTDKLLSDLLNRKPEVQANLAADFPLGHVLAASTAAALLEKVKLAVGSNAEVTTPLLIKGLPYLASYLSRQDGPQFWALVQKQLQGSDDLELPIEDEAALAQRERWADLQSTLGADLRFDRATLYGAKNENDKPIPGVPLYLPKARHIWTYPTLSAQEASDIEPITGFVRIPGGTFKMGQAEESGNEQREINIENPFYIARHLTTVDQYASFVDDGGYAQDSFWDKQGIEWREGRFDSKVENKDYREYLDRRTPDLRKQPMDWNDQRSYGSRPVMRLSWFEARAYTRWLQERLGEAQPYQALFAAQGALAGYKVALPTEAQWERAARAQDLTRSDPKRVWPWEGDDKTAHLKANIAASKIGRASVVGLFEPNPAGLHDMVGNLWEWQDNLYDGKGDSVQLRLAKDKELKSLEDLDKSDLPALRGGSWNYTADFARCSSRSGLDPDYWYGGVGFRVVLSLANLKSET